MTASVTRLTAERINESDHTPKIGIHEVESQVDFSMKGFELPVCVDSPDGLYDIGTISPVGGVEPSLSPKPH